MKIKTLFSYLANCAQVFATKKGTAKNSAVQMTTNQSPEQDYEEKDNSAYFIKLVNAAQQGDADAQYNLGGDVFRRQRR